MLLFFVFAEPHSRRSLDSRSRQAHASCYSSPKSNEIISLADPHPLNSVVSYRYRIMGGAGSASGSDFCPNFARLAFPLTPLEYAVPQNAPLTPLECAVPKTKDLKFFRMRRSEKSGGMRVNC